jgi:hypothetical protein
MFGDGTAVNVPGGAMEQTLSAVSTDFFFISLFYYFIIIIF